MPDPPYESIARLLKEGKVVPFLGSAASSFVNRPINGAWDAAAPGFLPTGAELSNALAREASFPSDEKSDRDDLAKVASYYSEIAVGRDRLRERLRQLLNGDYPSGSLHQFLAGISIPMVFVVTNYDTLLENEFRRIG